MVELEHTQVCIATFDHDHLRKMAGLGAGYEIVEIIHEQKCRLVIRFVKKG